MQYDGQNYQNQLDSLETCYLGAFKISDYESNVKNTKFKMPEVMADQYGKRHFQCFKQIWLILKILFAILGPSFLYFGH
jgi:uncharacterized membrane protein